MTIHDLCEQARNTACACGAPPGCPCVCAPRHYHYARLARAARDGLITTEDFAQVIHDADVFQGMDTVTDPGGDAMRPADDGDGFQYETVAELIRAYVGRYGFQDACDAYGEDEVRAACLLGVLT